MTTVISLAISYLRIGNNLQVNWLCFFGGGGLVDKNCLLIYPQHITDHNKTNPWENITKNSYGSEDTSYFRQQIYLNIRMTRE